LDNDETPVDFLAPGNGKTKTGYFWTTSRPGGDVVYQWETSRSASCLDNVLPVDFKGVVQCDGYAGYASFARRKEHIQLAACWAHCRRKIHEARAQDPRRAAWLLRQIGHLYRIERSLRDNRSGPRLRAAVRAHQARPIYQRLYRVLTRLKIKRFYLPRSGMGLALDYLLNLWPLLGVYLDDGRVEIDNNLVENAIRPTALGKKNWLFIGEAEAGERSAILYTSIHMLTCAMSSLVYPLPPTGRSMNSLPRTRRRTEADLNGQPGTVRSAYRQEHAALDGGAFEAIGFQPSGRL
jgi:transposase